jgi:23S rRNA (cytidine2498-2'-O)-methyltransferase
VIRSAYLAAEGLEQPLLEELERAGVPTQAWHGRLALSPAPPHPAAWALDVWTAPQEHPAPSVKAAADTLRGVQRNWSAYAAGHHRRTALITERLPPVRALPLRFSEPAPTSHLGAWTLLEPDRLLLSPTKTSPFPGGECRFQEDHIGPPSRAYLKLWEALTRLGEHPGPGDRCVDLGASPGGWTWALAQLGAGVRAVDKAPLDPRVAALPGVEQVLDSAFALPPEPADWLFSDVIAYPPRLLGLVERWIAAGCVRRIVCSVKFQGPTDADTAAAFAALPGGRLAHLFHNKHELTFFWSSGMAAVQAQAS